MVFINLKRGVVNGKKFLTFTVNGVECVHPVDLLRISNQLTGATNPEGFLDFGIFTRWNGKKCLANRESTLIEFYYGDKVKSFSFMPIDFERDDVLTIENCLKDRVKQVKTWISSVDHMEELEFVVE